MMMMMFEFIQGVHENTQLFHKKERWWGEEEEERNIFRCIKKWDTMNQVHVPESKIGRIQLGETIHHMMDIWFNSWAFLFSLSFSSHPLHNHDFLFWINSKSQSGVIPYKRNNFYFVFLITPQNWTRDDQERRRCEIFDRHQDWEGSAAGLNVMSCLLLSPISWHHMRSSHLMNSSFSSLPGLFCVQSLLFRP